MTWQVVHSDAVAFLASLPTASVDAIITDPPYPEIDRPYGRLTETEWHALMRAVVAESRRILKPSGSAVFILQPNFESIARVRPWLWEFMAWTAREWNQIQDFWWLNPSAYPTSCATLWGLGRASLKACVWLGAADCFRDQGRVLWSASDAQAKLEGMADRCVRDGVDSLRYYTSGAHIRRGRMSATSAARGGVTPMNVLPIPNANSSDSAGSEGHGAGTPLPLAAWWTRYICPPGGAIADPFVGSGTMGIAAVEHGATFQGADKMPEYVEIARRRIERAARQGLLALSASGTPTPENSC